MIKNILFLFLLFPAFLFSKNIHLEKGIDFCKNGNVDSALYHLNLIGDEVTIETSNEDIFNKNYYTAKCYDHIEANKSAEYYYLQALSIMDSSEFSNADIYLDLGKFYQRINNYVGSNKYLSRYYEVELERLGQEAMTAAGNKGIMDSLEASISSMVSNEKKLESDIRLLIVLITVFGLAFLVSLFLNLRNKSKNDKNTKG